MFYCLTHLVLNKKQSFKWPIDKTVLHLNDDNTKEKWEVDLSLKHLCFFLSHYHKNINSFGWLPYKPTTCTYVIETSKPMGV